jgi:hypothetical protein
MHDCRRPVALGHRPHRGQRDARVLGERLHPARPDHRRRGRENPTQIAPTGGTIWSFAIDSTSVYWANAQVIVATPLSGLLPDGGPGEGVLSYLNDGPNSSVEIALDATGIYFMEAGTDTVMKLPLTGGTPTTLVSETATAYPLAMTVDATSIYWSNEDGTIQKAPLAGGNPTTIVSGETPFQIAVDATSIYWTNTGDGSVAKAALDGTNVTVLAPASTLSNVGAFALAIDDANVYFATGANNDVASPPAAALTIQKVPLGGGNVTTMVAGSGGTSIAIDGTSLYYAGISEPGTSAATTAVLRLTPK